MTDTTETNMVVIRRYFMPDLPAGEFSKEYKALADEDKEQLGEGIRNGSLTY